MSAEKSEKSEQVGNHLEGIIVHPRQSWHTIEVRYEICHPIDRRTMEERVTGVRPVIDDNTPVKV